MTSRRAMALIMSALMLAVIAVPLVSLGSNQAYAVDTGAVDVTYHSSKNDPGTKITYYGIASAEYNPVYWNSDNGKVNWVAPSKDAVIEGTLRIEFAESKGNQFNVPEGMNFFYDNEELQWNFNYYRPYGDYNDPTVTLENGILSVSLPSKTIGFTYYPSGYITIPFTYNFSNEISSVFAGWTTTPTDFDDNVNNLEYYEPGDIIPDGVKHLYAVWYTPNIYYSFDDTIDIRDNIETPSFYSDHRILGQDYTSYNKSVLHPNNPYTEIIHVPPNVYVGGDNYDGMMGDSLSMGTYRSADISNLSTFVIAERYWDNRDWGYKIDGSVHLTGNVIMDNIVLQAYASPNDKHGGGNTQGLFANGYKLIIGSNVSTVSVGGASGYPQIFGGADEGDNDEPTVTGTDVVIFSGTYYNIVAGNFNKSFTGDTHLVIRGNTKVLDTVVGGTGDSDSSSTIHGSTYIYILGGTLPADSYQESKLGASDNIPDGVFLDESTILTGGSNNGRITGDTNVYISGTANLWDVQGGGRRGQSVVQGTVNVEVSGQAAIRHVLCGSITDGLNSNPSDSYNGSVKNVRMTIKDNAMVASVFGAGYDTYFSPNYASMLGGGDISIMIEGGTIGYVYGGGYRGAVGYSGNLESSATQRPLDSISINMSGGTVLEDIFGGGRGGVDKVLHDVNGNRKDYATSNIDSTGYAWTCVDTISITISGGTVGGSVYGGGKSVESLKNVGSKLGVAKVEADEIIIDISGGTVGGSVYGGGKGVSADTALQSIAAKTISFEIEESDTTSGQTIYSIKDNKLTLFDAYADISDPSDSNSNYGGYAQVGTPSNRPTIQIGIAGNSSIGDEEVSVFGAGNIAMTYADGIEIELGDGTSVQPTLKGDVHGGGYGTTEVLSVESDRTIILNNARVEGNIFGGTRNGDDGTYDSEVSKYDVEARIYLIAGTVTQNVYGGGFQGESMYNSWIFFGTPAITELLEGGSGSSSLRVPYPTTLRVGSIYGGGYFNPSGYDDGERPELLRGNVTIEIGSSPISDGGFSFSGYGNVAETSGSRIAIYGDVFGEGSFSTIGGESSILFDGYTQTSSSDSQRVRSVQLADTVTFSDSVVDLRGSSNGATEDLTEMMSLNGIGKLILRGHSTLTLYTEMNEIGGYESQNVDGTASVPSDFTEFCGNTLRLMKGAMAMVLGPGNDGTGDKGMDGLIEGFTIIENGGDVYYGAFAMGSSETDNENAGFLVQNDDGTHSRAPFIEEGEIQIWYISGASSIERMLTFSPGANAYADSTSIIIPKISNNSNLHYTGAYIDYSIQDSMYVVNDGDYSAGNDSEITNYLRMAISPVTGSNNESNAISWPIATHVFNGGVWQAASPSEKMLDGSSVTIESSIRGGVPTMSGLLGYVVIHIIESNDYAGASSSVSVPIHTINLIIGIYVEPSDIPNGDGTYNIDIQVTLIARDEASYEGTGYIPLPVEGGMYRYTLNGFKGDGVSLNALSLTADTTHFGRDGWISSGYMDGPYELSDTNADTVDFGLGGVISPVIRVDYSGSGLDNNPATLRFNIVLYDMEGNYYRTYDVTVTFKYASDVNVYLQYTEISGDQRRFVLEVAETTIQWIEAKKETDIGDPISVRFGAVLEDLDYETTVISDKGFSRQCSTLQQVLDALNESIGTVEISGKDFNYGAQFIGWFSDSTLINMFDLGSEVSQDIILYGKYGVSVTFHYGDGTAPYQVMVGFYTSLNDNGMFNYNQYSEGTTPTSAIPGYDYFSGSRDYIGHILESKNGWVVSEGSDPYNFGAPVITDQNLYLIWNLETYEVIVEITDESGIFGEKEEGDKTENDYSLSGGTGDQYTKNGNKGTLTFNVEYGSTVSISFEEPFHVGSESATGTYGEDDMALTFRGQSHSTRTLTFAVPDAGDDVSLNPEGSNGKIHISVTITDKFDVIVELEYVEDYTSELESGDSLVASTSTGEEEPLNSADSVTINNLASGTTITVSPKLGTDNSGYSYSIAVWVDGTLVISNVGDYTVTVGSDVINPRITVAVFKVVTILNTPSMEYAHISGIGIHKVQVPEDVNGRWGYSYSAVSVNEIPSGGYQINENDAFIVYPMSGYEMVVGDVENTYPSNTDAMTSSAGSLYFVVNGDDDVVFQVLRSIQSPLAISFEFHTSDGMNADQNQIGMLVSNFGDLQITLVFNGIPYSITIADAQEGVNVSRPTSQTDIPYSVTLSGFQSVSDEFSGGSNAPFNMTVQLIANSYQIEFIPVDGASETVGWDVFEDISLDGMKPEDFETAKSSWGPLFVKTMDGSTPERYIEEVSPEEFDVSGTLRVKAVSVLEGWIPEPPTHRVSVVVTVSTVKGGTAVIGKVLGDEELTFRSMAISAGYDPTDGTLTFTPTEGQVGTGSVSMAAGDYLLILNIVADTTGWDGE